MKGRDEKIFVKNNAYHSATNHEGSKTKKVVGLFMAAVLAVSTGCYLLTPPPDDEEDKKDQNHYYGSGGSGYRSYSTSGNGQISEGVAMGKGGIGSGTTGGAE